MKGNLRENFSGTLTNAALTGALSLLVVATLAGCGNQEQSPFDDSSSIESLARSGNTVSGPFTAEERDVCRDWGGGRACDGNAWNADFANGIREYLKDKHADGGGSASTAGVDTSFGARLAQSAKAYAVGFTHRCWAFVNNAIVRVTGREARMGMSSLEFYNSYANRPGEMKRNWGLCKSSDGNRSLRAAPVGSVIIHAPGHCGFSAQWGHGEIKVSNELYCSDGCQNSAARCAYATQILIPCGTD